MLLKLVRALSWGDKAHLAVSVGEVWFEIHVVHWLLVTVLTLALANTAIHGARKMRRWMRRRRLRSEREIEKSGASEVEETQE